MQFILDIQTNCLCIMTPVITAIFHTYTVVQTLYLFLLETQQYRRL